MSEEEIKHEGKVYILKSKAVPKSQVETMIKERVSKVAAKVTELEQAAKLKAEALEKMKGNQASYDVMQQQLTDLQRKLEESEGRFTTYQSISKYGITDPNLIKMIEWQYKEVSSNTEGEVESLSEWLTKQIENPTDAPLTIRPHIKELSNSSIAASAAIQERQPLQAETQPEKVQQSQPMKKPIQTQQPKLVSSNNNVVRTPEGEDVWKRAINDQNYYNQNYEQVQQAWVNRYAKPKR